ncbi:MAG TPA: hypothetical protein PKW23_01585 [Dictyoglomaceae bacterium]|nr:hypothetical protein [Dictyoglomaceae bacterium]HOP95380.1 hypothetical protein [Dictyoglomaceae bacterium]
MLYLFLVILLIVISLLSFVPKNDDHSFIGIFTFEEYPIRSPEDGVFISTVKELEKVRVGQVVGHINTEDLQPIKSKISINQEYDETIKEIDAVGEKINLLFDEMRLYSFKNDINKADEVWQNIKSLIPERNLLFQKLIDIEKRMVKITEEEKEKNTIYAYKSGYIIFSLDELLLKGKNTKDISPSDLKRIKNYTFINKKITKDSVIAVIREFPPQSLIIFTKDKIPEQSFLILNIDYPEKILIKTRVIKTEILNKFYKITTLPLEVNNIILKERIIEGKIEKSI